MIGHASRRGDTSSVPAAFDDLLNEADAAPITGWDFSWLIGRATEERPWWEYSRLAAQEASTASALLDLQTGGGEVLAEILTRAVARPELLAATEAWPPNLARARRNLARFGVSVEEVAEDADLPFDSGTFELVLSRHPVEVRWDEVNRVLMTGGMYLAQHVGAGSNRELTEFLMGRQPASGRRSPERAVDDARAAGLSVLDIRSANLRVEFFDVGAVVYFLRMVVWTVPGFSVESYRDRLLDLHRLIHRDGSFVSHARRFLIEAVKPGDQ
jgi:SAM-dependent methyltransferase